MMERFTLLCDLVVVGGSGLYCCTGGRLTVGLLAVVLYFCVGRASLKTAHLDNDSQIGKPAPIVVEKPVSEIGLEKGVIEKPTTLVANSDVRAVQIKPRTKKKRVAKVIKARPPVKSSEKSNQPIDYLNSNIVIFYSSLTGSSQRNAKYLYDKLNDSKALKNRATLLNLDIDIDDYDNYFFTVPEKLKNLIYILVLPSYETDSPIDYFIQTINDNANDFRIDKYPLRKKIIGYSVIGIGDKEHYGGDKFCYQAIQVDQILSKLGGNRIFPLSKFCIKYDTDTKIKEWIDFLVENLLSEEPLSYSNESESTSGKINLSNYNDNGNSDYENGEDEYNNNEFSDNESNSSNTDQSLIDVEDMGKYSASSADVQNNLSFNSNSNLNSNSRDIIVPEVKEMISKDSPTYKALTKQGYTIVGTHSGVKICRWTKSALRGRGSCYKFAFYGIKSHLCMETTPSLSCSNKCVFCWRHGTNPVGTSWRWQVDGPELILKGALEGHYKKIKQMRGVPGVKPERFQEAFRVRHCALSLVGEPIFYPYINEFVGMLHEKEISSFLVCNAQHPEQLRNLKKVTQLYVSIDASTKSSLKKVDRPLFKDFWERLISCLDILNSVQKRQRTVFRLTLVKGFNMGEVDGYVDLIERGQPSLIEIKGATFCGSSSGNGNPLTMQNIPFYEECRRFVIAINEGLRAKGLDYDIAAEHAHSCCILVAQKRYCIDGKWFTHIDYKRFFELLREKGQEFDEMEYISETPQWAYWGSKEAGFNPDDVKFSRSEEKAKNRAIREAAAAEAAEAARQEANEIDINLAMAAQ
ncbi:putative tRNA 4-demethylwyosine synthase ASCRUDRAFT_74757, partial [Ascoidea rubescens DSM 1968]